MTTSKVTLAYVDEPWLRSGTPPTNARSSPPVAPRTRGAPPCVASPWPRERPPSPSWAPHCVAAPPATSSDGFDRSVFAKKSDRTPFAYRAVTYGSRVRGGALPASSGTTSYQAIGCTNVTAVNKTNAVASVKLPASASARA